MSDLASPRVDTTVTPDKTPGQIDYERDCKRTPNYHDGRPRKTWAQLDPLSQWSWERRPAHLRHGA